MSVYLQSALKPASARSQAGFDDKVGIGKALITGFQHCLVMTPASIAVPLILASALKLDPATTALLVSASFFTSGITTLIHAVGIGRHIGARLPIIIGSSFAPLAPMIMIGKTHGLAAVFGAVIGSGVLILLSTLVLKRVLMLFPTVVVGCFVTLIGLSLAPVALIDLAGGDGATNYGEPKNLILGGAVLVFIILLQRFGKGFLSELSILIGLVVGTIASIPLGMLNVETIVNAQPFAFMTPFHFGAPIFDPGSILLMTVFCIVNMLQCIAGYKVLDEITDHTTSSEMIVKGIRAQAVGQIIAGAFNGMAGTYFKENIGLIRLTKVRSRWVIVTAAVMMICLGIVPKFAAILTAIPKPVLGGATLYLFGIIAAAGLSILSSVDFKKNHHFTIIGTSIAMGVATQFTKGVFDQVPSTLGLLLGDGLFVVAISAVLLNLLFNGFQGSADDTLDKTGRTAPSQDQPVSTESIVPRPAQVDSAE